MDTIKKIKAEIERLQQEVRNKWKENPRSSIDDGFLTACSRFLDIVNSLQQEKPEFPTTDEEVEKALASIQKVELPDKYKTPDWLFKQQEPYGLEEAAEKYESGIGSQDYCYLDVRDAFKSGAIWMFEKAPSEQAIAYVKASHSASEVSEFQAAMNIATAKAFDAGAKWMAGQGWNIDSYQKQAQTFLLGKFQNMPMFELAKYCTLGLNEEAGEVAGKIKKSIRDADGKIDEGRIDAIVKEMGDVLWYLAIMAHALGVPLSSVASRNIEKLTDRKERDKIQGEGDNR